MIGVSATGLKSFRATGFDILGIGIMIDDFQIFGTTAVSKDH